MIDAVGTEDARLHSALGELRLRCGAKVKLGRQFVHAGVTGLTLDGVQLNHRLRNDLRVTAWGGAKAPIDHAYEIGDFDQDAAVGTQVSFRPNRRWRLGVSAAYRERLGVVAERPIGFEAMTRALANARILGRAAYD